MKNYHVYPEFKNSVGLWERGVSCIDSDDKIHEAKFVSGTEDKVKEFTNSLNDEIQKTVFEVLEKTVEAHKRSLEIDLKEKADYDSLPPEFHKKIEVVILQLNNSIERNTKFIEGYEEMIASLKENPYKHESNWIIVRYNYEEIKFIQL